MEANIMPLVMASPGEKLRVVSLAGGRGLQGHMINMGLGPGSEIEVVKPGAPGPFLIAIKDTRLALGYGIAKKIMVSVNSRPPKNY